MSYRCIHCSPHYQKGLYILQSTVQKLFNSPGFSKCFVVVGTEVSREEEERESLRAIWEWEHDGKPTMLVSSNDGRENIGAFRCLPFLLFLGAPSSSFCLAQLFERENYSFYTHIWLIRVQRWGGKRKKWGPKSGGHGNMEESSTDGYLLEVGSAWSFPDASHAYCSLVLLPFPFDSHSTEVSGCLNSWFDYYAWIIPVHLVFLSSYLSVG
jgi:hypothetical protein